MPEETARFLIARTTYDFEGSCRIMIRYPVADQGPVRRWALNPQLVRLSLSKKGNRHVTPSEDTASETEGAGKPIALLTTPTDSTSSTSRFLKGSRWQVLFRPALLSVLLLSIIDRSDFSDRPWPSQPACSSRNSRGEA